MESLTAVYDMTIRLDVKRETDQGSVLSLASNHPTGTLVLFNKIFKDIDAIAVTPNSTVTRTAIYTFTDVPDPTEFHVLAFDNAGTPVDCNVSWIARGIV